MMYANGAIPSYTIIITMMFDTWDSVDQNMLRINHALAKTVITTIQLSVTDSIISLSHIDTTSFLKYASINLIDKSHILNFYQNLATQATDHNIFIRPHADITVQKGVVPDGMLPESQTATATALYIKFYQAGTIYPSYTEALNLLAATTDGFLFLDLLLQQSHPLLLIKSIATIDILKYSDFNDMYRYAREVALYVANLALEQRSFFIKETTLMLLSHLDNLRYKLAVKDYETEILHLPTIPVIYTIPEIVGTIDQLRPTS